MRTMPHVTTLATGLESTVYRLSSDFGTLIMKKRRRGGKQHYPFEAFAYTQLRRRRAKVPEVLFADDDILIMTALAGDEMDNRSYLYHNVELYDNFATDLARCHSIQLPGFGEPTSKDAKTFVGAQSSWREYLTQFTLRLNMITPTDRLTQEDLQILRSYWSTVLPTIELDQGVLLHGDFAMTAIFVDEEKYTGLIDFGDALIGDPLIDLAYFRYKEITKPYGVETFELFKKSYVTVRGLPWDTANNERLQLYMIYWGVRRLEHCPDKKLHVKFEDKMHEIAQLIRLTHDTETTK